MSDLRYCVHCNQWADGAVQCCPKYDGKTYTLQERIQALEAALSSQITDTAIAEVKVDEAYFDGWRDGCNTTVVDGDPTHDWKEWKKLDE